MLDKIILIYESNSKVAHYLCSIIKEFGYPTAIASNADELINKIAELVPEVVLFNTSAENLDECLGLANDINESLKAGFLFIGDKKIVRSVEERNLNYTYKCIIEPFEKVELGDCINSVLEINSTDSDGGIDDKQTGRDREAANFISALPESETKKEDGATKQPQIQSKDKEHEDEKPKEEIKKDSVLKSILEVTHSCKTISEILTRCTDALLENMPPIDYITAYKLSQQNASLICWAGLDDSTVTFPTSLNYSKGVAWAGIISEDVSYIKDIEKSKYITDTEKQAGFKCCLSLPLKQNGVVIGSLNLFSVDKTDAFSSDDIDLLSIVISQIELTLSYLNKNEELRESEDRFQNLFDKSPVGVLLIDNSYKIYQCNRRTAEMLQTTFDKLVGMDIRDLGNDKFTSSIRKMFKGSFSRSEFSIKIPGKRKDLWLMASLSPSKDSNDDISGGMIVIEDITNRKKMENSITEEKEMLSITLRSIGDGVITTDSEGKILLMNRVAEQITEWNQKDALSKKLEEVLVWDIDANSNIKDIQAGRELRQGRIVGTNDELKIKSKTDKQKIINASSSYIKDNDNNIVGNVVVFRDITEKQKLRQELVKVQKLESLETLAGGIAHDFNNILTGIIGNLSLSKMYVETDDKIYKRLSEAEIECFKAADLTKQLINFAEGVSPNKKISSIADLVKESVKFLLTGSKVKCSFECSEDIWLVEVDQKQFVQAIYDIALNSLQAMPEGGSIKTSVQNVRIKQNVNNVTVDGEYVRIIIEDSGCGIDEEHLSKIYDPYFTTKENHAGLGLSNTYTTIKSHKGFIKIESTKSPQEESNEEAQNSHGTKVSIFLPASRDVIPLLDEEVAQTEVSRKEDDVQQGRILVMDDDEIIREIAGSILGYLGYEVSFASEGKDAVELYKEAFENDEKYDVVIMDLTVPGGMGAEDTIKKLKEIDPDVRAIVTSGYSNAQIVSNFYKYGFKGAVIKPYKIEELTQTVKDVLVDKNINSLPI